MGQRTAPLQSTGLSVLSAVSVIAAATWAVARVGPSTLVYMSGDAARAMAWPNPGIRIEDAYTRSSALDAWLFKALGHGTTNIWVTIHIVGVLIGLALMVLWIRTVVPYESGQRARAVRLALLGPATAVLVTTVGSYDPFTFVAMMAALFAWRRSSPLLMALAGILVGIAHAEQGFLAFTALAIGAHWGRNRMPASLRGLRTPLWIVGGVMGGRLLLSIIIWMNGIDPLQGRSYWLTDVTILRHSILGSLNFFPVLLMSAFAGLWGFMVVSQLAERRRANLVAWILPILVLFGFSMITLDHTRIFAMVSLPIVLVLVAGVLETSAVVLNARALIVLEVLAWVIVPLRLLTSPDGPTYLMEINAIDQSLMFASHLVHGGWT